MKTPKEKAHDLVVEFWYLVPNNYDNSETFDSDKKTLYLCKECAKTAVHEILKYHDSLMELGLKDVHQSLTTPKELYTDVMNPQWKYWKEVLTEIEKL